MRKKNRGSSFWVYASILIRHARPFLLLFEQGLCMFYVTFLWGLRARMFYEMRICQPFFGWFPFDLLSLSKFVFMSLDFASVVYFTCIVIAQPCVPDRVGNMRVQRSGSA